MVFSIHEQGSAPNQIPVAISGFGEGFWLETICLRSLVKLGICWVTFTFARIMANPSHTIYTVKQPIPNWWLMAFMYGVPMGLLFAIQNGSWIYGSIAGVICGVLFATGMVRFAYRRIETFEVETPNIVGEVLYEGGTNHFKGIEAVGGYLWVTDKVIHFKSHKLNIQNHELIIPVDEVSEVILSKTLKLIPNGVILKTSKGQVERFVVNKRDKLVEVISRVSEIESLKANKTVHPI